MATTTPSTLRVAILQNYQTTLEWGDLMMDSFETIISQHVPNAQIIRYCRMAKEPMPQAFNYDLIILTGGVYDLFEPELDSWVKDTLQFLRDAETQQTKVLGICWGHQAVVKALGGVLDKFEESGSKVGVYTVPLNEEGEKFFAVSKALELHKFHKRYVAKPAPGFIALAENNEILLSRSNNMLTFQGHPEMTAQVSGSLLRSDDGAYTSGRNEEEIVAMRTRSVAAHDGIPTFKRILEWVWEKPK